MATRIRRNRIFRRTTMSPSTVRPSRWRTVWPTPRTPAEPSPSCSTAWPPQSTCGSTACSSAMARTASPPTNSTSPRCCTTARTSLPSHATNTPAPHGSRTRTSGVCTDCSARSSWPRSRMCISRTCRSNPIGIRSPAAPLWTRRSPCATQPTRPRSRRR